MSAHKMPKLAYEKALKTKPQKSMRVSGNGKPGQSFNIARLEALCAQYKVDPAEITVLALADPNILRKMGLKPDTIDGKDRLEVALKLMEYTYAKRKAVEVSGEVKEKVTFVIEN